MAPGCTYKQKGDEEDMKLYEPESGGIEKAETEFCKNSIVIGNRIKNARKAMNMTQEELGRRIDSDGKYICRLETGKYMPSLQRLVQLSRVLERTCDYFIGDINVDMVSREEDMEGGSEDISCGRDGYERDVIRIVYDFLNDMSSIMAMGGNMRDGGDNQ